MNRIESNRSNIKSHVLSFLSQRFDDYIYSEYIYNIMMKGYYDVRANIIQVRVLYAKLATVLDSYSSRAFVSVSTKLRMCTRLTVLLVCLQLDLFC
jgi:hypothetical protein